MSNRTDLILGLAFCIFIFFHFPGSALSVLPGLHFYFSWRDSENTELTAGARDRNKGGKKARKKVCGQSAVECLWVFLFLVFPPFLRILIFAFT